MNVCVPMSRDSGGALALCHRLRSHGHEVSHVYDGSQHALIMTSYLHYIADYSDWARASASDDVTIYLVAPPSWVPPGVFRVDCLCDDENVLFMRLVFGERAAYFRSLCSYFGVPKPIVAPSRPTDPCDFTSSTEVRLNVEAAGPDVSPRHHAAHVFGHYLGCLHAVGDEAEDERGAWCDLVAEVVSTLILRRPPRDPFNPQDRCTCSGEGHCEWCRSHQS